MYLKMNTQRKHAMLLRSIIEGSGRAVLETADFEIVMARGARDAVSTVKGYGWRIVGT